MVDSIIIIKKKRGETNGILSVQDFRGRSPIAFLQHIFCFPIFSLEISHTHWVHNFMFTFPF